MPIPAHPIICISTLPRLLLLPPLSPQFKRDAVASESGADRQLASLKEQRRLLEEQAATLQRQVDGLVQVGGQREEGWEEPAMRSDLLIWRAG